MKIGYNKLFNITRRILKESVDEMFKGTPDMWEMAPDDEDPDFPNQHGVWHNNDAACFGYFDLPYEDHVMIVSSLDEYERTHYNVGRYYLGKQIMRNLNEEEISLLRYAFNLAQKKGFEFCRDEGLERYSDGTVTPYIRTMVSNYLCRVFIDKSVIERIYPEYARRILSWKDSASISEIIPGEPLERIATRIVKAYNNGEEAHAMSNKAISTFFPTFKYGDIDRALYALISARYDDLNSLNRDDAVNAGRLWYDKKFIAFWGSTPSPEEMKTVLKDIVNADGYEGPSYEEVIQTFILGVSYDKAVFLRDYMSSTEDFGATEDNGMDIRIPHEANPMEKERLRKKLGVKRVQGNHGSEFIPKDLRPGELMAQYHARKYQESRSLIGKILREEIGKVI